MHGFRADVKVEGFLGEDVVVLVLVDEAAVVREEMRGDEELGAEVVEEGVEFRVGGGGEGGEGAWMVVGLVVGQVGGRGGEGGGPMEFLRGWGVQEKERRSGSDDACGDRTGRRSGAIAAAAGRSPAVLLLLLQLRSTIVRRAAAMAVVEWSVLWRLVLGIAHLLRRGRRGTHAAVPLACCN